jgi:hypothetical protein
VSLNAFKSFKAFKAFKLLPLFLPRVAGESLPRTRSGDEGGGLNGLNGLNVFEPPLSSPGLPGAHFLNCGIRLQMLLRLIDSPRASSTVSSSRFALNGFERSKNPLRFAYSWSVSSAKAEARIIFTCG